MTLERSVVASPMPVDLLSYQRGVNLKNKSKILGRWLRRAGESGGASKTDRIFEARLHSYVLRYVVGDPLAQITASGGCRLYCVSVLPPPGPPGGLASTSEALAAAGAVRAILDATNWYKRGRLDPCLSSLLARAFGYSAEQPRTLHESQQVGYQTLIGTKRKTAESQPAEDP